MGNRGRTPFRAPSSRAQDGLARNARQLEKRIKATLPEPPKVSRAGKRGLLRAMRELSGVFLLSKPERVALLSRLREELPRIFATSKIKPRDLGVKSVDELVAIFLRMVERLDLPRYSAKKLREVARHLIGSCNGELFELLVVNLEMLHADLRKLARFQRDELNALARMGGKNLVDARGRKATPPAAFGPLRKATDVVAVVGNSQEDFVDLLYVSLIEPKGPGGKLYVGVLLLLEAKLPASAKEFGKQLGKAQARFAGADKIVLMVEGQKTPLVLDPTQIVFSTRGTQRIAISNERAPGEMVSVRSTELGGYLESYLRVDLSIQTRDLRSMTRLLFPSDVKLTL
jgi:hypothetical protein